MDGTTTPEANGYIDGGDVSANTAAMIRAVDTEKRVILQAKTYVFNANITPTDDPEKKRSLALLIKGAGVTGRAKTIIQITHDHGIALQPKSFYEIEGVIINAPRTSVGIGSIGQKRSAARSYIKDVFIGGGWIENKNDPIGDGILFDDNFQHPLGLTIDRVSIQYFINSGCSIGEHIEGTVEEVSGESAVQIGRLLVNGNGGVQFRPPSWQVNVVAGVDSDELSWSVQEQPRLGFLVIRRAANGPWQVVPSLLEAVKGSSVKAAKKPGETFEYQCLQYTIGVQLHRLKAVSVDVLQSEYTAIGSLFRDVTALNISAHYTEQREDRGLATIASIYLEESHANIGTMWAEQTACAVISKGSDLTYQQIKCAKQSIGAIGLINTGRGCPLSGGIIIASNFEGGGVTPLTVALKGSAGEHNKDHLVVKDFGQKRVVGGGGNSGFEVFYREGSKPKAGMVTDQQGISLLFAERAQISAPNAKELWPPIINIAPGNWIELEMGAYASLATIDVPENSVLTMTALVHLRGRYVKGTQYLPRLSSLIRLDISAVTGLGISPQAIVSAAQPVTASQLGKVEELAAPVFHHRWVGNKIEIRCFLNWNLENLTQVHGMLQPISITGSDVKLVQA